MHSDANVRKSIQLCLASLGVAAIFYFLLSDDKEAAWGEDQDSCLSIKIIQNQTFGS